MHAAGKIFTKTYLKAIRDFFLNMWSVIRRQTRELDLLAGVISNRRRKFKLLGLQEDDPPSSLP